MFPLYRDPHFTFRFGDDRIIPRVHLDGVACGTRVRLYALDPVTGERLEPIATAVVGAGGWVNLPEPIVVRAGSAFGVVPNPQSETVD
jgi:hypothetical protein